MQLAIDNRQDDNPESRISEWNESYTRGDNNILYPQTEVVKFLNRYVVKRTDCHSVERKLQYSGEKIRCLDFACGVGTHSIICDDFGIEAWGVDISENAIEIAMANAIYAGQNTLKDRFLLLGDNQVIPFEENYFQICIAESCLDSMPFNFAKKYIQEITRVVDGKIYISLISARCADDKIGEVIISTEHEKGTVQTFYNKKMIAELIGELSTNISSFEERVVFDSLENNVVDARYFLVLDSH